MINEIIDFLNKTVSNDGYYVNEFLPDIFFGKDKDNNIVCAKLNTSKEMAFSMSTKAITLYQNYHFTFTTNDKTIDGNYDLIVLNKSFVDNKKTFINLCLNFYRNDYDGSVIELTTDLIDMYKISTNTDDLFEEGLWAEFFTILYINETYGINISDKWHNDIYNKFDFSLNDNKKIEVKATSKEIREHKFSHEQLYTDYGVLISSVQLRTDDNGISVFDLYNQIQSLFPTKYDILLRIEQKLLQLEKNASKKYDIEYARSHIRFYMNENIPHFKLEEPDGVHGTEYTVVLENERYLEDKDIIKFLSNNNN